jgi:membrane protein DedA with SNARE-associated domain/rhodanese-related sulfurtransferase
MDRKKFRRRGRGAIVTHPLVPISSQLGLALVFGNVLLDQIGLPLPAAPTLVIAGALAADHRWWGGELFLVATVACLIADASWFLAGRLYGERVMKTLCRISLTPDSCVNDTQQRFERWGANAIIFAKFIPGLAIIAPPLAGALRMGWLRFLGLSALAAALWVTALLGVGVVLKPQIDGLLPRLTGFGGMSVLAVALLLTGYIAFKWWERRRFYSRLRMARIGVAELNRLMGAQQAPLIVDVRSHTARALEPRRIPGALHVSLDQVGAHVRDLPRDRDIVLYCTCPNEASAARVAKLLINHGFTRVRPLLGGLDAWIAAGYAVDTLPAAGQDDLGLG